MVKAKKPPPKKSSPKQTPSKRTPTKKKTPLKNYQPKNSITTEDNNAELISIQKVKDQKLLKLGLENLFDALIYPLNRKEFFTRIFQQKALIVKNQDKK